MMKKKEVISKNYLEKIPSRYENIQWDADEKGMVTLHIENKGFVKKLTQIILKKPKMSHIHLDETGSFVWPLIDGNKSIMDLAEHLDNEFGQKAHPLYERIAKFIQILESYNFVQFK